MKKILASVLAAALLAGCNLSNTVGNGKVDPTEALGIRVAVSTALELNPQLIEPARAVTDAILSEIDQSEQASFDWIDEIVEMKATRVLHEPLTIAAFKVLVDEVRTQIKLKVKDSDITTKVVVVKDVIKIINEVAVSKTKLKE